MSRHFKKESFEAFTNKNIDAKATASAAKETKATPIGSSSAEAANAAFGQKEFKVVGEKKLNLKLSDGGRILRALWDWGKDAEKRKSFNPAEARYVRHAKGRALCLLAFGCVWAYYNPEHSILSRKWHEYRAGQLEKTPSNKIVQLLAEEGAEVRVMREAELAKEEAAVGAGEGSKK